MAETRARIFSVWGYDCSSLGQANAYENNDLFCLGASLFLQACSGGEPVAQDRYMDTDQFVSTITDNIEGDPALELIADIDHSRSGREAGSPMAPSRVVIFSDKQLEAELIQLNPLAALDLPLRVLAFESGEE